MANLQNTIYGEFGLLQTNITAILNDQATAFNNTFVDRSGLFQYSPAGIALRYQGIKGIASVTRMGTVIDMNAKAPIRQNEGIQKINGEIPKITSGVYSYDEQSHRDLISLQTVQTNQPTVRNAIFDRLINSTVKSVTAVKKTMDFIAIGFLSGAEAVLSTTTNSQGRIETITLAVPSANKYIATSSFAGGKVWSDITCLGLTMLRTMVTDIYNRTKVLPAKTLMDLATFNYFCSQTEVINAIKGTFGLAVPNLETINQKFTQFPIPIPPIEIINEVTNYGTGNVSIWKAGQVTMLPSGTIGTIEQAIPSSQLSLLGEKIHAYTGAIDVASWAEEDPFRMCMVAEWNAFPMITATDYINMLNTAA